MDVIWSVLTAPPTGGVVLFVGICGAFIAAWGVISNRAIARRKATLDLITSQERDGDIIKARNVFIDLAKKNGGLAPYAELDREADEATQSIRTVLNEFELISIGIQRGILDFELYRRWHRSGVVKYWEYAAPFVHQLRQRTNNRALFYEFEELARWMRDETMPKRGRFIGKWF